jgi:crossover junction endodeoxyribonuclease RuvC
MLVLGVDPGSRVTGYGLIEKENRKETFIDCGHIRSPDMAPFFQRIHHIFQGIVEIMNRYHPQEMAIEDIFYAKNVKSSLKLGHARGAILVAAAQCGVRIFEYPPLEIKKAVVGYGRATKEQVRYMVQLTLTLKTAPDLDASDALAAALCHLNHRRWMPDTDGPARR